MIGIEKTDYNKEIDKLIEDNKEITNIRIEQLKVTLKEMDRTYLSRLKVVLEHRMLNINKLDPFNVFLVFMTMIMSTWITIIGWEVTNNVVIRMVLISIVGVVMLISIHRLTKDTDKIHQDIKGKTNRYIELKIAIEELLSEDNQL
ncbi:hypothetical protein [Niameybacter massiliensis]|uniref:hypothetical protein n=1 Tax=Niameybacter massiliensis TaxID=1658108 RepID=UPI0006B5057A|nr:hypothetical protein [Niameybacter massiliensis]